MEVDPDVDPDQVVVNHQDFDAENAARVQNLFELTNQYAFNTKNDVFLSFQQIREIASTVTFDGTSLDYYQRFLHEVCKRGFQLVEKYRKKALVDPDSIDTLDGAIATVTRIIDDFHHGIHVDWNPEAWTHQDLVDVMTHVAKYIMAGRERKERNDDDDGEDDAITAYCKIYQLNHFEPTSYQMTKLYYLAQGMECSITIDSIENDPLIIWETYKNCNTPEMLLEWSEVVRKIKITPTLEEQADRCRRKETKLLLMYINILSQAENISNKTWINFFETFGNLFGSMDHHLCHAKGKKKAGESMHALYESIKPNFMIFLAMKSAYFFFYDRKEVGNMKNYMIDKCYFYLLKAEFCGYARSRASPNELEQAKQDVLRAVQEGVCAFRTESELRNYAFRSIDFHYADFEPQSIMAPHVNHILSVDYKDKKLMATPYYKNLTNKFSNVKQQCAAAEDARGDYSIAACIEHNQIDWDRDFKPPNEDEPVVNEIENHEPMEQDEQIPPRAVEEEPPVGNRQVKVEVPDAPEVQRQNRREAAANPQVPAPLNAQEGQNQAAPPRAVGGAPALGLGGNRPVKVEVPDDAEVQRQHVREAAANPQLQEPMDAQEGQNQVAPPPAAGGAPALGPDGNRPVRIEVPDGPEVQGQNGREADPNPQVEEPMDAQEGQNQMAPPPVAGRAPALGLDGNRQVKIEVPDELEAQGQDGGEAAVDPQVPEPMDAQEGQNQVAPPPVAGGAPALGPDGNRPVRIEVPDAPDVQRPDGREGNPNPHVEEPMEPQEGQNQVAPPPVAGGAPPLGLDGNRPVKIEVADELEVQGQDGREAAADPQVPEPMDAQEGQNEVALPDVANELVREPVPQNQQDERQNDASVIIEQQQAGQLGIAPPNAQNGNAQERPMDAMFIRQIREEPADDVPDNQEAMEVDAERDAENPPAEPIRPNEAVAA